LVPVVFGTSIGVGGPVMDREFAPTATVVLVKSTLP
jgi:hypothetical protein